MDSSGRNNWKRSNASSQKAQRESESGTEDGVRRNGHEHEASRNMNAEHSWIRRAQHTEFE